ncbi:hypothetical protein DY000_02032669 [Brassica cretica]|uniref:Uncharacterized protein n=1 Tax=Brassica cretica TaxID=69181 RepID=A0ABQ7DTW2_BRACR|nr:hypothetical protein DY000_02032669 [Brassica cretica]
MSSSVVVSASSPSSSPPSYPSLSPSSPHCFCRRLRISLSFYFFLGICESSRKDFQYEDLLKMVSEDFRIQEEDITLRYEISLELKIMVEDVTPISIGNTCQLSSFIGKIRGFDGICRFCIKVITDSASYNKQTTDPCAYLVLLNFISDFGSTVQREKQTIYDSLPNHVLILPKQLDFCRLFFVKVSMQFL